MRTRVRVTPQVAQFVKSLAPEPRRALRLAIKALAQDKGELKRLEENLRLHPSARRRASRHFPGRLSQRGRVIDCVFAEKRAVVYELFIKLRAEEIAKAAR